MSETQHPAGGCTCGHVRYRVTADPLIVHGCHCRWCQRQSGSAFAINALLETECIELTAGEVVETMIPSPGGKGQRMARCPECGVTVWSNYYFSGLRDFIRFLRVGTLDNPDLMPPDVHIYTSTKQPRLNLPEGSLAVEEYYKTRETWSAASLKRLDAVVKRAGI